MREYGIINTFRLDLKHGFPETVRPSPRVGLEIVEWKPTLWKLLPAPMLRHLRDSSHSVEWWQFVYWWLHYFFCRWGARRHYSVRLMVDHGRVVYFSVTRSRDFRFPFMRDDDLQVGPVWTDPSCRRLGIGTAGLADAISDATRDGWRAMWWLCRDDNVPSNRLAESAGFQHLGQSTKCRTFFISGVSVYRLRTIVRYATVTEVPGQGATADQRAMQYARYGLAARYANGKYVLEVACGSGMGLGLLSRRAKSVVGGDIDEENCRLASATYRGNPLVGVGRFDAHDLPFLDSSLDVALLFEAIYYLGNAGRFIREARRILKPGGVLLICSVNCDWQGFNPSPFSARYYNAADLRDALTEQGFETEMLAGFPDGGNGYATKAVRAARGIGVRLNLIPRTMKGKEWLKLLFYGRLEPMRTEICDSLAGPPLVPVEQIPDLIKYRVLYAIAKVPCVAGVESLTHGDARINRKRS